VHRALKNQDWQRCKVSEGRLEKCQLLNKLPFLRMWWWCQSKNSPSYSMNLTLTVRIVWQIVARGLYYWCCPFVCPGWLPELTDIVRSTPPCSWYTIDLQILNWTENLLHANLCNYSKSGPFNEAYKYRGHIFLNDGFSDGQIVTLKCRAIKSRELVQIWKWFQIGDWKMLISWNFQS